ncbi:MAG: chemotaxis protein CheD [Anaerolineae bacterium]|nr:chemotaxis protein CheD [Anaerolineae bacterium]
MAEKFHTVPIGEMVVSAETDEVLVVYGLGSCVVVCLYDPAVRVGGMLHALLPTSASDNNRAGKPSKFVDQGVPLLIEALTALGAKPERLVAQLCGGIQRLTTPGANGALNIGERNVQAARTALHTVGLEIGAEATGGRTGRTVKLYIATGRVTVHTLGQEEVLISHP